MPRDMRDDISAGLGVSKDGFERVVARSVAEGEWRLFQKLLTQILWQLDALGFRAILVLCGHFPLAWASPPVVEAFNREGRAQVAALSEAELSEAELIVKPGNHAARWETSLGPSLLEGLVHMERLPPPPGELIGILGPDARVASAEEGWELVEEIVAAAGRTVTELLRRTSTA